MENARDIHAHWGDDGPPPARRSALGLGRGMPKTDAEES